ncbi:hypothetical protein [Psychromonas hadalis]|uniref:hypothetical protein n=1 Tax=Psychromonas hadalis TaxID=211669 RepID=UPI0003B70EA1|nr:hypothetical protein [Psychromonas hadalis]
MTDNEIDSANLEKELYDDYDNFKIYRDTLLERDQKVSEGLDKAILAISSTALGLIFAFSKSIWLQDNLTAISLLKFSWLLLGLSLFCVLSSLVISGLLNHIYRHKCDRILENRAVMIADLREKKDEIPQKLEFEEAKKITILNNVFHFSGPVFLIIGVLCVGIFFNLNFGVQNNEQKTSATIEACTESITGKASYSASSASATTSKKTAQKCGVIK